MRTINELLEIAQDARTSYKNAVDLYNQERRGVQSAIEQAQEEALTAAAVGDREAYKAAKESEEYNKARSDALSGKIIAPYFTVNQHNELVKELKSACKHECSPHYKALFRALETVKNEASAIKELQSRAGSASWILLHETGCPTHGRAIASYNHFAASLHPAIGEICAKYASIPADTRAALSGGSVDETRRE